MKIKVTMTHILFLWLISMTGVISLLPLFAPLVEEAKYTAEAKPVISAIRSKVQLYQNKHSFLPGLAKSTDASIPDATTALSGSSRIGSGMIQGFVRRTNSVPERYDIMSRSADEDSERVVPAANTADHIATDVGLDFRDFIKKRLRPSDVFYRCDAGGCDGGAYMYVVGVFGGPDSSLRAGTGFAVLEICSPAARTRRILTWERYKPATASPKRVVVLNKDESAALGCTGPATSKMFDICWIPNVSLALASGAQAADGFNAAMERLKAAGWK